MKQAVFNYLVIAALVVAAVCTSCGGSGGSSGGGGKGLSGTYEGYPYGRVTSYTFSGNKFKFMRDGKIEQEGTFETVEEYKEDDFSRGTIILTHREGKDEENYTLEGKILTMDRVTLIKGGKSVKIPNGTYSSGGASYTFSGNNLTENYDGRISEGSYEFIVGYENKGISKGYILLKRENGDMGTIGCVLEKDKLTFGYNVYTKE